LRAVLDLAEEDRAAPAVQEEEVVVAANPERRANTRSGTWQTRKLAASLLKKIVPFKKIPGHPASEARKRRYQRGFRIARVMFFARVFADL
jgi:ABC-type sugar transport system substrate-binding protein